MCETRVHMKMEVRTYGSVMPTSDRLHSGLPICLPNALPSLRTEIEEDRACGSNVDKIYNEKRSILTNILLELDVFN